MSNFSDHDTFSDFVRGIVDPQIRAIAMAITTSTGYFKSLIAQATTASASSQNSAAIAQTSSVEASTAAASTIIIWNSFTSLYGGVAANDPQTSSLGHTLTKGAFYVRSSDNRLRIATNVNSSGVVTWSDATVVADVDSVIAASEGRFLSLTKPELQTIAGLVAFADEVTVPTIADDWTSAKVPNAQDVYSLHTAVDTKVTNEITRAKAAEEAGVVFTQQEVTRALAAENALGVAIGGTNTGLSAETTRAIAAEQALGTRCQTIEGDLTSEVTRAKNSEGSISDTLTNFMNLFSSGKNSYGCWSKKPGVVEMWGEVLYASSVESNVYVNLPLETSSLDYVVTLTPLVNNPGDMQDLWVQIIKNSKSTTGFNVQYQSDDNNNRHLDGFEWRLILYGTGGGSTGNTAGSGGSGGSGTNVQETFIYTTTTTYTTPVTSGGSLALSANFTVNIDQVPGPVKTQLLVQSQSGVVIVDEETRALLSGGTALFNLSGNWVNTGASQTVTVQVIISSDKAGLSFQEIDGTLTVTN